MRYGDYFMNHDIRILSLKDRYNGMSQGFWSLLSYEWGPLQIALERFQRVSMGWNKFQLLRVYVLSPHWNPSAFRGICRGYVFHQFITGSWAYLGWTSIFKNGGVRSMWDNFAVRFFVAVLSQVWTEKNQPSIMVEIIQTFIRTIRVFHPCFTHEDTIKMLNSDESLDLFRPTTCWSLGFFVVRQIFRKTWGTSFWGVCVCKK